MIQHCRLKAESLCTGTQSHYHLSCCKRKAQTGNEACPLQSDNTDNAHRLWKPDTRAHARAHAENNHITTPSGQKHERALLPLS